MAAPQAIPFTPPMVRALDERRKTRISRHVAPQPMGGTMPSVPYRFMPGDLLWVAERWRPLQGIAVEDVSQPQDVEWAADDLDAAMCNDNWMPALALPQAASRFTLLVQSVGFQRVQDLSPDDCLREGVCQDWFTTTTPIYTVPGTLVAALSARDAWRDLWIDLHGSEQAWTSNPYIWRCEVTLIRANVGRLQGDWRAAASH